MLGPYYGPQSEDCLTLNIWSPVGASNLPVLVWIYGGGFIMGSGRLPLYEGSRLAATAPGAIVVTFNYRIGALGFLVLPQLLEDDPTAINFGILDQQLALKWVQTNIVNFGGDPSRVTLFGQSVGSFSCSLHYVLPSSWGLFRRIALESGTVFFNDSGPALQPSFSKDIYLQQSAAMLRSLGCDNIACARALNTSELLQV
jgi:para-nitrobenzyl esterase